MLTGKLNPAGTAAVNFPGFQIIDDWTSAGGEASHSVAVNSDTDKEYKIYIRNTNTNGMYVQPNNDTSNGGFQYHQNNAGTVTAAKGTQGGIVTINALSVNVIDFSAPTGLSKMASYQDPLYGTGTTVTQSKTWTTVWNVTDNITTIRFIPTTGNHVAGTQIIVFARRSQA